MTGIIYICKRCNDRLAGDKLCPRVFPPIRGKDLKSAGPGELCGGSPVAVNIEADLWEVREAEHARIVGETVRGLLSSRATSFMVQVERAASMRFIPTRNYDGHPISADVQMAILRERVEYRPEDDPEEDPVLTNSAMAALQRELAEHRAALETAGLQIEGSRKYAAESGERLRIVLNELSELSAEREALFTLLRGAIGADMTPEERLADAVDAGLPPLEFFQRELRTLTDVILSVLPKKDRPLSLVKT